MTLTHKHQQAFSKLRVILQARSLHTALHVGTGAKQLLAGCFSLVQFLYRAWWGGRLGLRGPAGQVGWGRPGGAVLAGRAGVGRAGQGLVGRVVGTLVYTQGCVYGQSKERAQNSIP